MELKIILVNAGLVFVFITFTQHLARRVAFYKIPERVANCMHDSTEAKRLYPLNLISSAIFALIFAYLFSQLTMVGSFENWIDGAAFGILIGLMVFAPHSLLNIAQYIDHARMMGIQFLGWILGSALSGMICYSIINWL